MLCKFSKNKVLLILGILMLFLLNTNFVFAEYNYSTGSAVYGILADTGNTNITGALNLTLQVGTCFFANCSDINWSAIYTNATYTSLASLSNTTYFQYRAAFSTQNQNYTPYLFNISIFYTYLDTTSPLLNFVYPTPENNSGASGQFTINATITELNLKNATLNWNGTLIFFNSSNETLTDLGDGNWLFTYNKSGLVVGQSYTYSLSVSDYAGNANSTETRTIRGNTAPSIVSLQYSPNDTASLDPGVIVAITINVSDTDNNFDSAILQWKNSTDGWNNITMENLTSKDYYTVLNTSLTLPDYEDNLTFRVLVNDTTGDSATSSNYAIQNFWDCTWNATSDLGPTSGWDENKFIGNITLNNTGDYNYSNKHCSLDFRLTYDLTEGRVYLNGDYVKPTNIITIDAGDNYVVEVNATFLSEIKSENGIITTSEIRSRSATSSRGTTFVLVSNQAGPYLYQSITTYPASVYLTSGNFSLNGYVRNLMGDGTENNTAYNVSFYWDLPSGLINSSGNQNTSFDNLTNNSLIYNPLIVGFSSLSSMTPGVDEVYLHSQGYDKDGNLIVDANNDTLLSNSISINFLCYNASDGICVSGCGYTLDSDCKAPETPGNPSGGGGGGGAASTSDTIMSKADFEFVRGNTSEIIIPFINKDENTTMTSLEFSLEGDIAKYISVSPSSIASLGPQESIDLHLEINSPGFIQLGKQALVLVIKGMLGKESYNERRIIVLQVNDISKSDAEQLVNESGVLLERFKAAGLNYSEVDRLFDSIQESFNDLDYSTLQDSYNKLSEIVNSAIESKKIISEIRSLIADAKKKGISVSGTEKILDLAELSFSRNDFTMALSRAQEGQHLRLKQRARAQA